MLLSVELQLRDGLAGFEPCRYLISIERDLQNSDKILRIVEQCVAPEKAGRYVIN